MELLQSLGINGKLLLSQIVNFSILMALLMYFVYKPILRLIDSRRETIRKSLEDAKEIEHQKREIEQFSIEQMRKIDQEGSALFESMKKQAEAAKKDIVDKAHVEAAAMVEKTKQMLEQERRTMLEETRETVVNVAIGLTQKILEKEFTPADQKRLLQSITKDLPQLVR